MVKNLPILNDRYSPLLWVTVFILSLLGFGCGVDSAKNHFILAEKLWSDKNYPAAVSEFEKVIVKDPKGKLGLLATYRAATTQYLFLGDYSNAIRKFRAYAENSTDPVSAWDSQIQIGEIYYSSTDQYDQAILHYQSLLKLDPEAPEAAKFLYRIGKSQFYLFQFAEAISTFEEVIRKANQGNRMLASTVSTASTFSVPNPSAIWAEKAAFEIGSVYLTRGEQKGGDKKSDISDYQSAILAYEKFIKTYPKSELVPEARFGIASSLEELNQLESAYAIFNSLKGRYPSPNLVDIKLIRIRKRIAQRNR